jgi:MFS transporter, DHA2 family, multidrug resistance protein
MSGEAERLLNQHDDWLPHNPWVVAGAVILAPFMEILDTSIANVALPHIAGNLSASTDESTWVLTSYLVANAIVLPLSGWLSSLVGRKRLYIWCVILFTISSFLCGLAPSITWLVLFRIMQGAAGGALQPLAQSILIESFPTNKRGMAMAMFGMCVVVAPIIGPTLGGWITDNYTWRWIFFINIPVGITALFLAMLLIEDPPYFVRKRLGPEFRIDYIGLGLIALGLGALQIVLDKGEREDWFDSHFIIMFSVICAVCLVSAVFWELRQKDPIIKLKMLKDRNFAVGVFLMYALGFSLYGSTMLLPLFLQNLMGYNALTSGLVLSPGGIVTMLTMPLVGLLMMKIQARWLIIFGLIVSAAGLFITAKFNLQISYSDAVWARCILSAGLGFLFVPINTAAYYYIAKKETDYASGLINLARNLGGSAGISFVMTMLARRAQFHQDILVSHVNETNPIYIRMFEGAKEMFVQQGINAVDAAMKAKAVIYGFVKQQASMLAFIDNFWLLGVVFIVMIPLVFLMKKTGHRKDAVQVH